MRGEILSQNKTTVTKCLAGFAKSDIHEVLSCLTEDVEWLVHGAFHLKGRESFREQLEHHETQGPPAIEVAQLVEEGDVVVAEGTVRTSFAPGALINLAFCDVFQLRNGLVARLTTYLVKI